MISYVELWSRIELLKSWRNRLKSLFLFNSHSSLWFKILWWFLWVMKRKKHVLLWCHLYSYLLCFHSCLLCSFISFCLHSHLIHFCWWLFLSSHLWCWSCNLSLKKWRIQWALIWTFYFIHSINMIACACFVQFD